MWGGGAWPGVTQPPAALLGPRGRAGSSGLLCPFPRPGSDGAWWAEQPPAKVMRPVRGGKPAGSFCPAATAHSRPPQASIPAKRTDRQGDRAEPQGAPARQKSLSTGFWGWGGWPTSLNPAGHSCSNHPSWSGLNRSPSPRETGLCLLRSQSLCHTPPPTPSQIAASSGPSHSTCEWTESGAGLCVWKLLAGPGPSSS